VRSARAARLGRGRTHGSAGRMRGRGTCGALMRILGVPREHPGSTRLLCVYCVCVCVCVVCGVCVRVCCVCVCVCVCVSVCVCVCVCSACSVCKCVCVCVFRANPKPPRAMSVCWCVVLTHPPPMSQEDKHARGTSHESSDAAAVAQAASRPCSPALPLVAARLHGCHDNLGSRMAAAAYRDAAQIRKPAGRGARHSEAEDGVGLERVKSTAELSGPLRQVWCSHARRSLR